MVTWLPDTPAVVEDDRFGGLITFDEGEFNTSKTDDKSIYYFKCIDERVTLVFSFTYRVRIKLIRIRRTTAATSQYTIEPKLAHGCLLTNRHHHQGKKIEKELDSCARKQLNDFAKQFWRTWALAISGR